MLGQRQGRERWCVCREEEREVGRSSVYVYREEEREEVYTVYRECKKIKGNVAAKFRKVVKIRNITCEHNVEM